METATQGDSQGVRAMRADLRRRFVRAQIEADTRTCAEAVARVLRSVSREELGCWMQEYEHRTKGAPPVDAETEKVARSVSDRWFASLSDAEEAAFERMGALRGAKEWTGMIGRATDGIER